MSDSRFTSTAACFFRNIISNIALTAVLFVFYSTSVLAEERWQFTYDGQTFESLSAAESALRSEPGFLEVWRSGGTVNNISTNDTFVYQYKAIRSYFFANERCLNGIACRSRAGESDSVGGVIANIIAASIESCQRNPVFNTRILSMTPMGAYDPVTNQLPVSYTTTVRSTVNCQVPNSRPAREDVIKAALSYPTITAQVSSYASCSRGNPCSPITGAKTETEVDYQSEFLEFRRYYNSVQQNLPLNEFNQPEISALSLPAGWTHSYSRRIERTREAGFGDFVPSLVRDDGTRLIAYRDRARNSNNFYAGSWAIEEVNHPERGSEYQVKKPDGSVEIYERFSGNLTLLISPEGLVTQVRYGDDRFLEAIISPYGHRLLISNNGRHISKLTLPDSNEIIYSFDPIGSGFENRLSSVTYQDGTSKTYHYEDSNSATLLTGISDERGVRYSTFEYDARGRAILSVNAGNVNRTELTYNNDGSTSVISENNHVETFYIDDSTTYPRVSRIADNDGEQLFSYQNTTDRLSAYTDKNGNQNSRSYYTGSQGAQLASSTEALGSADERTRRYTYKPNNAALIDTETLEDAAGQGVWSKFFEYDDDNRITLERYTDLQTGVTPERTTTYQYDADGRLLTRDGPRTDINDITTYTYHSCNTGVECGGLQTVTDAVGNTTTVSAYNPHGQPTEISDPNGVATSLTYDTRQRLTSRTTDGQTLTISYDATGNITRVTLPDSTFTEYTWDGANRLVAISDAEGNRIEWSLDIAGNRTTEVFKDPSSAITKTQSRVFDEFSRMIALVPAHGGQSNYGYDPNSNQTTMADAANRLNNQTYDALDRLSSLQDAIQGITTYEYDTQDNIVSVTDPEDLTTSYTYNGFRDQLSVNSPDTGVTTYTVDEAGNRISETDARGVTVNYSYDALNRLTTVTYPDSALNITYSYDQGVNGKGRLTGISDESGSMSYSYDGRGNLITVTQTIAGQTYTQSYQYNGADRPLGMTLPSGRVVDYTYDASGRINNATADGESLASSIARLPFGPSSAMTLGNGITRTRSYDLDYRIQNIDDAGVLSRNYAIDAVDNITAITDGINPAVSQLFTYDALDRLDFATGNYGDKTYGYDGVGNRESLTTDLTGQGGSSTTQSYNYGADSHRLSAITGERTFQYDAAGNTLANGPATFSYNDRSRMATSTVDGLTTAYQHNALGQRVIKSNSVGNTHYLYDLGGRLIAEADGSSGEIQVEYTYLDGEPLAMWRDAVAQPLDTDGDGTPDDTDLDDDNDGVDDVSDVFPLDPAEDADNDEDGIGDNADTDDDNDGVEDTNDAFPQDATEDTDSDGDGTGDNADTDDDNDGVEDTADAFPFDPAEDTDSDGDGIGDNADPPGNDDGGAAGSESDVTVSSVNDWGSGFIATFVYNITADDTINGGLTAWRIEVDYTGNGQIINSWMTGYGGSIINGDDNGQYRLTNEGVGFQPTLAAGDTLTFSLQGQGSGYVEEDFTIRFISLDQAPTDVEPVTTAGTATNVNDWYNPAWGGGFNATFECELQGETITSIEIAFNYSGTGTPSNSWTQGYNGAIESGFIAADGGYAIRSTGFVPDLNAGDMITSVINVQGAGYSASDFAVQCTTGGGQ